MQCAESAFPGKATTQAVFKDRAYCHRLTGRRKLRSPSYVSAKGSVSVVEESDASSAHRVLELGKRQGSLYPTKKACLF